MSKPDLPLYVGQAKEIRLENRDPFIRVEVDMGQLEQHMKPEHLRSWTDKHGNEHKVLALMVTPLRIENRNDYKTHCVKIDTYKAGPRPKPKVDERDSVRAVREAFAPVQEAGDVPF